MPTAQRTMRAIARQQLGLVSALDARTHGITQKAIQSLLSRDVLTKDIRGVYRFLDEPQPTEQALMAAVLWTQRASAALSHTTALALHGLLDLDTTAVHVTVAKGERIRIQPLENLNLHYENVDAADIERVRYLPVVSVYTALRQVLPTDLDDVTVRGMIDRAESESKLDEHEAIELRTLLEQR